MLILYRFMENQLPPVLQEYITHRPQKELQADHAWKLYSSLQEMIRFADYKVYLLYMIAGVVLSLVFSEFKDLLALGLAFKILIALLVASSGFLILYSMKTMMPRASTKHIMKSQKLIYFLDIASQEDHEFVQHFLELPTSSITEDVLVQIAILSDILKQKFYYLNKAMWSFYGILFIVLLIQIFKLF